jgi:hypothetical protein
VQDSQGEDDRNPSCLIQTKVPVNHWL